MAAPISSLNLLISSLVWRQDPGFLDLVSNKSADITTIYLPPDANCLLSVTDHCLRSVHDVNVIVSDKQLHPVYLDMDARLSTARRALAAGSGPAMTKVRAGCCGRKRR
jgi:xylulose-5-phosphate/fructose-6-phosphate phosphoketolase